MKMVNDGRLKGQTRWPRCASRSARYWRAFENKERARKQKVDNHSKMEGIPRRGNQHVESALFSFMTGKIPVVVLMDVLLDQLHMTDHLNIISKQKAKKQNEENENWFIISQRWDKNICITQRHHHPFNHLFCWRGGAFFTFLAFDLLTITKVKSSDRYLEIQINFNIRSFIDWFFNWATNDSSLLHNPKVSPWPFQYGD